MLILQVKENEHVNLYSGDHKIVVKVKSISDRRVSLGFLAPDDVCILRGEIDDRDNEGPEICR